MANKNTPHTFNTASPPDALPSGEVRRGLPAVSALLEEPAIQALIAAHSRPQVVEAIRATINVWRARLSEGAPAPPRAAIISDVAEALAASEFQRIRPVVNATGIILHTGLGRAVLPQATADALAGANRCVNLQIDLETGLRGKRHDRCERLLCELTGAGAALVVNNNAAATLLVLAALCAGKEVVVSRGQLIEIGGSFRLPDCIHQSGAHLVEVGCTNKTHRRDYEAVLGENTGALLRVNPSNYRVIGFHKEVPTAELAALKAGRPKLLVIDDLGCGALVDLAQYGLPHEPTVQESLAAGADIVLFSGDKLIGGPQSGIIVGRSDLVQKIRKHPLTRMLRVGKLTDLALEHTLRLFLRPARLLRDHPTLRMIATPAAEIKHRALRLKKKIEKECAHAGRIDGNGEGATGDAVHVEICPGQSETGGGTLPAAPLPTWLLRISVTNCSTERLNKMLRRHEPPIIARIEQDAVTLDLRTVFDDEEQAIIAVLAKVAASILDV